MLGTELAAVDRPPAAFGDGADQVIEQSWSGHPPERRTEFGVKAREG